jgi:hypothetical protein
MVRQHHWHQTVSARVDRKKIAAVVPCTSFPPLFRHCVGGGSLATFTHESVITRILRHLKLASVPPPIAPARLRQELLAFDEALVTVGS